jgi:hypothetical protein
MLHSYMQQIGISQRDAEQSWLNHNKPKIISKCTITEPRHHGEAMRSPRTPTTTTLQKHCGGQCIHFTQGQERQPSQIWDKRLEWQLSLACLTSPLYQDRRTMKNKKNGC